MIMDGVPNNYTQLELQRVLPWQFFSPQRIDTGAKRLMLAVLEDAVNMYQKYKGKHSRRARRLFKETEEWFRSHDVMWLYTFENICDVLGWDAQAVRKALLGVDSRAKRPMVDMVSNSQKIS